MNIKIEKGSMTEKHLAMIPAESRAAKVSELLEAHFKAEDARIFPAPIEPAHPRRTHIEDCELPPVDGFAGFDDSHY